MHTPQTIEALLLARYAGLVAKTAYSERSLFYNPAGLLPNGMYFATLKTADGPHDKASALDRPGVFRLSFGLDDRAYTALFGPKPARPPKGGVVQLPAGTDWQALDVLTPHPVYAWMRYVCILNPGADRWGQRAPLLDATYSRLVQQYQKKHR
ncbi:MAG: DUF6194 family protein [Sphingobacteriia bacterium]